MPRDVAGGGAMTAPLLARPPSRAAPPRGFTGIYEEEISAACCRICLESDTARGDELISPCKCKGTQQFVHRSCLDHWRSVKEGYAFSHCTTCKAQFHIRVEYLENDMCRRMKFRLFVTRDVILVFLALQAVIAALGGMTYLLDKDGKFRNSFADNWGRILSKHPVPFYYCLGVVAFLVLVGFFGLIVHCFSWDGDCLSSTGSSSSSFNYSSSPSSSSSFNYSSSRSSSSSCGCVGGILESPASTEACVAFGIVFIIIFAVLGIAYCFFAATVVIQRIWQRHYHILTKKVLTKEYIVEDLHGVYTPPKMDREHEQRLRTLQLL